MTSSPWAEKQQRLDTMPAPKQTFQICADPDVRDRYQAAKQAASHADEYLRALPKDAAKETAALVRKQASDAHAELKKAQAAYDEHTVVLTFQALERDKLKDLIAEHPPTEEDEAEGSEFHFETFAPALISAASLDGMPQEYAQHAMKSWLISDSDDLWAAAWTVQQRKRTDLGKG